MHESQKSVRDGSDHWVRPLSDDNKRNCTDCGGEMGHIGELGYGSSPGSGTRVADLECTACGRVLRGVTLRGF
jgi:hypothetical protein